MASDFKTGFEIKLGMMMGCLISEGEFFHVETIADARAIILRHAMGALGHHAHDSQWPEGLHLNVGADGPTWEDLIQCQEDERYDPANPDVGMQCSYLLYRQGGLEGVGGLIWTYCVAIWVTAPPELWGHPADQPLGLDDARRSRRRCWGRPRRRPTHAHTRRSDMTNAGEPNTDPAPETAGNAPEAGADDATGSSQSGRLVDLVERFRQNRGYSTDVHKEQERLRAEWAEKLAPDNVARLEPRGLERLHQLPRLSPFAVRGARRRGRCNSGSSI